MIAGRGAWRRAGLVALLAGVAGACGTARPGSSAAPALPAGVQARTVEHPYDVAGTTVEEVRRSLAENRIDYQGGSFQGMHTWRIRWSFRYGTERAMCRMRSVDVLLESETQLPRWVDREAADSVLIRQWDTYIGRLRTHENGHRAISYEAAREILRALERVTSPTCGLMSTRANNLARQILDRHIRRNRAYDEETRHGRTEGLGWPPREEEAGPPT